MRGLEKKHVQWAWLVHHPALGNLAASDPKLGFCTALSLDRPHVHADYHSGYGCVGVCFVLIRTSDVEGCDIGFNFYAYFDLVGRQTG